MKKPAIAITVQALCVIFTLSSILKLIGIVSLFSLLSIQQVFGATLINLIILLSSIYIFWGVEKVLFSTELEIFSYLLGMLIIYPVINISRAKGYYIPAFETNSKEVIGAAAIEILRYVVLVIGMVLVARNKKLKKYLNESSNKSLQPTE